MFFTKLFCFVVLLLLLLLCQIKRNNEYFNGNSIVMQNHLINGQVKRRGRVFILRISGVL